jgi:uncharacterized membrane protein YdjX (TVP38/TMEM64 family)
MIPIPRAPLSLSAPPGAPPPGQSTFSLARIGALLLLLVALALGGRQVAGLVPQFTAWVQGLGAWGPLLFVAGYAVATVSLVPASLLTLAAGATFGVVAGTVYVLAGAILGSSAAFLISRYVARPALEKRVAAHPRFAAINGAVAREGRKIVFLLRLSPVFPFGLLNYALGVTRVSFPDFLLASVGMVPGTLLYTYSGHLAGDLAVLAAGSGPPRGPAYYTLITAGLVATVLVTVLVTRLARRALSTATGDTLT